MPNVFEKIGGVLGGLSKEAILEAVWGYTFNGEANIVEQYIRSLRQKMGEPQLIHTVRQAGYILREA